ncbi:MAG: hypothetical protein LJE85_14695 [Gammaproteobacteria bacterium]|jgi:hypothetical protein|nr:hypothetical protein [Gammaproteobacteria bacterium]
MSVSYTVDFHGKTVQIELTKTAQSHLAQNQTPLFVEMELYFSCLIRKKVRFNSSRAKDSAIPVSDHLSVSFHPVMTRACNKDYEGDAPPLTEFPIEKPAPYVPRWLKIDYKGGGWQGEFGYD